MAEKVKEPLYLIVGKSGSGKTSIVNYLKNDAGLMPVESYTTRAPRYITETGHIFLYPMTIETAMQAYPERVAETVFDGHFYFVTPKQLEDASLYVIDPVGVQSFKKNYKGSRPYRVVYIKCGVVKRIVRMIRRGDGLKSAIRRVLFDRKQGFEAVEAEADLVVVNDKTVAEAARIIAERVYDDVMKERIKADIAKAKAEKAQDGSSPLKRTKNVPEVK